MRKLFASLLVCLVALVAGAATVDVPLLFYVADGSITTPVVGNPLSYDVSWPDSQICDPIGGCRTVKGAVLKAGDIRRFPPVTPAKGEVGAYHAILPDAGLVAYSEIRLKYGALVRVGPLVPTDHIRFLDLIAPRVGSVPYNGWVILIASGSTALPIGSGYQVLETDEGILLPGPVDGKFSLDVPLGSPKLYAVGGINDPVTGSNLIVSRY